MKENNTLKKYIDTTIYSEHWFRCPNQSKGSIKLNESQNKHVIINGKIKNFIINYPSDDLIGYRKDKGVEDIIDSDRQG